MQGERQIARRGPRPREVRLSAAERRTLKRWAAGGDQRAQRARIVLLCADGHSNREIAEVVAASDATVRTWRKTFATGGMDALASPPAPSRERTPLGPIIARTFDPPPAGERRWTVRSMAAALGCSPSTVARAWQDCGITVERLEHLAAVHRPPDV